MRRREHWLLATMLIPIVASVTYVLSSRHDKTGAKTDGSHETAQIVAPRRLMESRATPTGVQPVRTLAAREPDIEDEGPSHPIAALEAHPGPHFGDPVAEGTEARWQEERVDRMTSIPREQIITRVFREEGASSALKQVECRETLCRIVMAGDANEGDHIVAAASKLGRTVVVLENNDGRVVALVPVTAVDGLSQ